MIKKKCKHNEDDSLLVKKGMSIVYNEHLDALIVKRLYKCSSCGKVIVKYERIWTYGNSV